MRIVSFNINGIRARPHQLAEIVRIHAPEVIGLQEIKVANTLFPAEEIRALGYDVLVHGQKAHYGVALLYRLPLLASALGLPADKEDAQRRLVQASLNCGGKTLHVLNGYFPQGENRKHPSKFLDKEKFYSDLTAYLHTHFDSARDKVLIMGDMNVAPGDNDVGIGENNRKRWLREGKCCFLPEERAWYELLAAWGLTDAYRHLHPEKDDLFTWFDYRSRGFERDPPRGLRIDHILLSGRLLPTCTGAGIDYTTRAMERPSDHCPVWADLEM